MTLIAVAAGKGSPGVTTTAIALASVWPRPALVAECDPSGGDLAMRLSGPGGVALDPTHGLLSYAAAARRGAAPLQDHLQEVEGGLQVLLGLQTPEQGSGLTDLWAGIASGLAREPDTVVIADCGRLEPRAPSLEVLRRADLVLLLARPALGAVVHLRHRIAAVLPQLHEAGRSPEVGVLVLAPLRHSSAASEVAGALEQSGIAVPVLGRLVDDPEGAAGLSGTPVKRLDRTWLVRSAREVALLLDERSTARRTA